MVFQHIWGLFTHPEEEWGAIRDNPCSVSQCYTGHVLLLAAIPAISGFIGTTEIGWQLTEREVHYLTYESAGLIAVMFYAVMLVGVYAMGYMIHWMGRTYEVEQSLSQCVMFAAYNATPLFLVGIMLLYPVLWLNMLIGLVALAYTVKLLYTGLPIMLKIPFEKGFLYASSVLAVGLVFLVALLITSVILWQKGMGPILA